MVKYDDINVGDLVLFRAFGYGDLRLGKVITTLEDCFNVEELKVVTTYVLSGFKITDELKKMLEDYRSNQNELLSKCQQEGGNNLNICVIDDYKTQELNK